MSDVQIKNGDNGNGEFFIEDNGVRIAFLAFKIHGSTLTAIHAEVSEAWNGKGIAAKLVTAMVDYARANKMMIVPLCPYVRTVFEKHPERYEDVWLKAS
jgi:predicted GNAT family acetyltransferase